MSRHKSSISKASSYEEIVEFWDTHSLSEYWDQLEPVEFEIDIQGEIIQYGIDDKLAKKISVIAKQRGISIETLINLWLQDELQRDQTKPSEYEFDELIEKKYYAIDHELSDKIRAIAKQWNVSATPLVNLWLQRKMDQLDVIPESDIKLAKRQYPVDIELSDKIRELAKKHGISAKMLDVKLSQAK
jgi:antitoxin component of RelBE/YafQ-DinJ toxin-antitoxin module